MANTRILFSIFISIVFCSGIYAQENLISNPGFEENKNAHANVFWDDTGEGNGFIPGWTHPGKGCPDYWDATGTFYPDPDFRDEKFEPTEAHSGEGRVGLTLNAPAYMDRDWDDYMDYMQTELIHPLKKDSTYYLEFYICLEASSSYFTNNVGAFFSVEETEVNGRELLKKKPQVCFSSSEALSRPGWQKISGYFTAGDNYRYMTVGTFESTRDVYDNKLNEENTNDLMFMMTYYYMDDFLLKKVDSKTKTPEVRSNVILVVDVSKSMYDGKSIDSVKTDLKNFILAENGEAKISIITFGSGVEIKSRETVFTNEKIIDSLLATFQDGSATNIGEAIETGYALVDSSNSSLPVSVILFSDAGFELSRADANLIKKHVKKKHVEFVVYDYGKHANPHLEKNVEKWKGIYLQGKKPIICGVIQKKKINDSCSCDDIE